MDVPYATFQNIIEDADFLQCYLKFFKNVNQNFLHLGKKLKEDTDLIEYKDGGATYHQSSFLYPHDKNDTGKDLTCEVIHDKYTNTEIAEKKNLASVELRWPKPLWVCIRVGSGIGGYFCRSYGNETEVFAIYVPYIPDNVTFECVSASVIPWTNTFQEWTPKFKWAFGPEGQTSVIDPQRTFDNKIFVADNDLTPGCLGTGHSAYDATSTESNGVKID